MSTTRCCPAIRDRPAGTHVIITGRMATPELIDFADPVTGMKQFRAMAFHPEFSLVVGRGAVSEARVANL
ncbi:MAG: cob(I)yrinic acid a,c-diamide adenosyltransferase [Gemmatimonadota bacterium]|nr:cob(I)yrinic acid a,c-diamide adenosyltransferase [Gemmatimonadota bacterium]